MFIDKNKEYCVDSFKFKNFINLDIKEKLMILRERNHPNVKKWMLTHDDIKEEDHLRFIDSLNCRNDSFYWLIEKDNIGIGVLSIVKCDYNKEEGETGYYLFSDYQTAGFGLELQYAYKKLFFLEFGFNNLPGLIRMGNNTAYLMTVFFGGIEDGIIELNGQKYLKMHTPKQNFINICGDKITSKFVKFLKHSQKNGVR